MDVRRGHESHASTKIRNNRELLEMLVLLPQRLTLYGHPQIHVFPMPSLLHAGYRPQRPLYYRSYIVYSYMDILNGRRNTMRRSYRSLLSGTSPHYYRSRRLPLKVIRMSTKVVHLGLHELTRQTQDL
ncbi:hypothetical protein AcV7_004032 [Taiwanofungus camphoratus]|nr:hypothetical protein AcV7_004032 [Antrodia cinnamomea]